MSLTLIKSRKSQYSNSKWIDVCVCVRQRNETRAPSTKRIYINRGERAGEGEEERMKKTSDTHPHTNTTGLATAVKPKYVDKIFGLFHHFFLSLCVVARSLRMVRINFMP